MNNELKFCSLRDYGECTLPRFGDIPGSPHVGWKGRCRGASTCSGARQCIQTKDFVYITVPKSASTAIMKCITDNSKVTGDHHIMKEDLVKIKSKFIFSFVRDPYTRLISCWKGWMHKEPLFTNEWSKDFLYKGMPFNDFICGISKMNIEMFNEHYQLQSKYLLLNNHFKADFVGKMENMSEDWSKISKITGLPTIKNTYSDEKYYPNNKIILYNQKSIEIVNDVYDEDFKLFGYKKIKL